MKTLTHMIAARFTQLDYDREMALILTEPVIPGKTELYGAVQILSDPDYEHAEFAIIVRHDMTGMRLSIVLMRRIIEYARNCCIDEIFGDVLKENTTMQKLCKAMGFARTIEANDPYTVRFRLKL